MTKDQEWDIKARSEACDECGRSFADKEECFSRLTFGPEGYARSDFCASCWKKADVSGALSTWRGVYRMPPPPPEEPLKKETAESLLRKLIEENDPGSRNTIYILAVMLERRRILTEKDVTRRSDGVKLRMYEHKQSGEVFTVPDPELKLSELEKIQAEVVARLGGKPGGERPNAAGDDDQRTADEKTAE